MVAGLCQREHLIGLPELFQELCAARVDLELNQYNLIDCLHRYFQLYNSEEA